MSNILVAGGCIGGIINNVFAKDIDLFVYGLSEDEANEKVLTLTTQLIEARKQLKKDEIAASKAKKSYYGSHNVEVKLIRNAMGSQSLLINAFTRLYFVYTLARAKYCTDSTLEVVPLALMVKTSSLHHSVSFLTNSCATLLIQVDEVQHTKKD